MQNASSVQPGARGRRAARPATHTRYGRLLGVAVPRPRAVLEVIVAMGIILALAYVALPADPLLLESGFPWLWIAASLFALRYGSLLGGLAGLCIVAAWFLSYGAAPDVRFPTMWFSGGFIQLLIAGHFCDLWDDRLNQLRALSEHLDDRLASITHAHFVLKVSHGRLEKDLLSKPFTLRDGVQRIRDLSSGPRDETGMPKVQGMLDFVGSICQIETASLFRMRDQSLDLQPIATLGAPFELDPEDPLIRECLQKRGLSHLRPADAAQSDYLACAPVMTASGSMMGVLVIRDMAFLSVNSDNYQLLLVLLNYYADGLEQGRLVQPVRAELPECPDEFALELVRLGRMRRTARVTSSLVALVFPPDSRFEMMAAELLRAKRTLDLHWIHETQVGRVLVFLLPLADEEGVAAFLGRVDQRLDELLQSNLTQANIAAYSAEVEPDERSLGLRPLLSRCINHV